MQQEIGVKSNGTRPGAPPTSCRYRWAHGHPPQKPGTARPAAVQHKAAGAKQKRLDADLLYIADRSMAKTARLHGQYVLQMPGSKVLTDGIHLVGNWDEFKALLQRYDKIKRLVLYLHGSSGTLHLHKKSMVLGAMKSFLTHPPQADVVEIEGCNVGQDPHSMAAFGRLLHSSSISAFNYFHITDELTVTVPAAKSRTSPPDTSFFEPWQYLAPYLLPNQPSIEELARRPGRYTLALEWFRSERIADLPKPTAVGELSRKDIFPRSKAEPKVYTADQADGISEESSPSFSFMRVRVQMSAPTPDAGPETSRDELQEAK